MRYLQNPDPGQLLPVPGLLPVALLGLVLVDVDLAPPKVLEDLDSGHPLASSQVEALLVGYEADRQLDVISDLAFQAVDDEFLTFSHPVLLSTAFYDRKHDLFSLPELCKPSRVSVQNLLCRIDSITGIRRVDQQ